MGSLRGIIPLSGWDNRIYKDANSAWESLYVGLSVDGYESAPRGLKIKETLSADITIIDPSKNIVHSEFRGISPVYMAKEWSWYNENPTLSAEDAGKLSKFWLTLADDNNEINSNYGYHLFKSPITSDGKETTLWESTKNLLIEDPDTRKAIIQLPIVNKNKDTRYTKDTICTSSLQFFIRDNKLYLIVYMRSNDIVLGFPYDVFQFTMMQRRMLKELQELDQFKDLKLGTYRHATGSLHLYEKHFIENLNDDFYFSKEESVEIPYDDFVKNLRDLNESKSTDNEYLMELDKRKKIWK